MGFNAAVPYQPRREGRRMQVRWWVIETVERPAGKTSLDNVECPADGLLERRTG